MLCRLCSGPLAKRPRQGFFGVLGFRPWRCETCGLTEFRVGRLTMWSKFESGFAKQKSG
jgi:hypothetical protein